MLRVVVLVAILKLVAGFGNSVHRVSGKSRLFLDDADIKIWDELLTTGIFYGITTNPTILQKANVQINIDSVSKLALTALDRVEEFMAQAWGGTADKLEKCSLDLVHAINSDRLIIKLPLTFDGIVAMNRLRHRNIPICATACYDRRQAITASALGCNYLAPYLGRMSDLKKNGLTQCLDMQNVITGMRANTSTRLLVASLRDTDSLFSVLSAGSDATFSAEVARDLLTGVPATDEAAHIFELAASS